MDQGSEQRWHLPRWTNRIRLYAPVVLVGGPLYLLTLAYYGNSAEATRVGYQPEQPVPYSHALHAGELGIDCRYCHNTVETTAQASIPPTEVCMNCHANIRASSEKIVPVRESWATGMPIEWARVHDLPDFVYFNHSAHVTRGVGCVECHGRVDKMEKVYQAEPLTMKWCLDCHRDPDARLRPPEAATSMDWVPAGDPAELGMRLREARGINPSTDCSTCHR
ncbi:MAG: cytochrome C [Candidatus Latescibacterota bacterium]|nr:MAG: cytochrome C [Candidatus Latescibacterota bacterium]